MIHVRPALPPSFLRAGMQFASFVVLSAPCLRLTFAQLVPPPYCALSPCRSPAPRVFFAVLCLPALPACLVVPTCGAARLCTSRLGIHAFFPFTPLLLCPFPPLLAPRLPCVGFPPACRAPLLGSSRLAVVFGSCRCSLCLSCNGRPACALAAATTALAPLLRRLLVSLSHFSVNCQHRTWFSSLPARATLSAAFACRIIARVGKNCVNNSSSPSWQW